VGRSGHEEARLHTYETIFITPPTLSEEDEQTLVGTMAQVVVDGGGQFTVKERMGRRRLAYPIHKHDEGVYTRFLYDADPAVTKELERRIRLSDNVIRSLTVRLEEDWAVAAKVEAVEDADRRARAQAEREAAEAEAEAKSREEADDREPLDREVDEGAVDADDRDDED